MIKNTGFTLLEVMIALAILAGGLLILNNSWTTNSLRLQKANIYNNAATLLQKKMVEMEAEYHDKPLEEIPESESGDFGSEFPTYRWEMKSQELEFPDLSAMMIGDGQGNETTLTMIRQMTELISKSVKELKVTIFVKSHKKEVKFSATTYFVSYKAQLGLSGGGGN
ncbi:MAG TPA: general secretion pathway protein GspI [Bdellovibrionales bacterium]|nr:general secretion pathway protein GspI [Pseudobdellovibrionaceae bacterium]HAG91527.1 general secretion pathway protein GspI [Bdellovibrionales bacterium]|tara:strand:- start:414 stop:914 length:501 start_codon:yes stop_codon:yes gene_type:complete